MPARALDYSGRDRPAGRECLVVAQVLRVVGQVAHARLHAGSPVIGQPARTGLRGDRLGDMPGPAGQHRQRLDGHPVLSGRIIPGMEAPRGGPQVLLLSTGPRPALIDVIDDREDRVLSSLLLSYPRGFSDEKKERGSWPIAWRCGLRTGIAPRQWSMRRMRRSGRLRSGWRRTGTCGRRARSAVTRPRWRSGGRSWSSAARRGSGPRLGSRRWRGSCRGCASAAPSSML
jgi:hypothetical protein